MRTSRFAGLAAAALALAGATTARAAGDGGVPAGAQVRRSARSGSVSFLTMRDGGAIPVGPGAVAGGRPAAIEVFVQHGVLFGVSDAAIQLRLTRTDRDTLGVTHTTFAQVHRGVPVFAGVLKSHQNEAGAFVAANGHFFAVSQKLAVVPTLGAAAAERVAVSEIGTGNAAADPAELTIVDPGWYGRRPQGVRLVYFVRVIDAAEGLEEGVFVDAHDGAIVDRWRMSESVRNRAVHDARNTFQLPGPLARVEGEGPTGNAEVDQAYDYSGDFYDYFFRAFGQDSYDGVGTILRTTVNSGALTCPNAQWTGSQAIFCTGLTVDDVVAHEFTHGVIRSTANLLYLNQSGQLNESYADIFGELIDLFNGDAAFAGPPGGPPWNGGASGPGQDTPNELRDESCIGGVSLDVATPESVAGVYVAGFAEFGPALEETGVAAGLAAADPSLACSPLVNDLTGAIAVVTRGDCEFVTKVLNAQDAGAVGVVVVNNLGGAPPNMSGSEPSIVIPSISITLFDGAEIRAAMDAGPVVGTLRANGTAGGVRWLLGEDEGDGAIRDMWNPVCGGDPSRADHPFQTCSTADGGGVHSGSGIPNHAFALLTDGGVFNGFSVNGIGPIKSAAVWYRALTVYLTVASDFSDAFAALIQSADDLVGTFPLDPRTGFPSGDMFTASDAAQVEAALLAVELDSPKACGGNIAILDPTPPGLCPARRVIYGDDFESGVNGWTVAHTPSPNPYDWRQTTNVPRGVPGTAWFGPDSNLGDCEFVDESAVHSLVSPVLDIPVDAGTPQVVFTHHMASEASYDGGNVWVSVNGAPSMLIPGSAFTFNGYNTTLFSINNTNPLRGQEAFSGIGGNWGTSIIDLSGFAGPGDQVQFRFEFGKDGCVGIVGWYLADFAMFDCLPPGDGDFDGSGQVDLRDHAGFQRCMGLAVTDHVECNGVDLDGDGEVGEADHALFLGVFGGP